MNFKYLGTAACEGFPAIFCSCESCKKAKAAGGRNIRTRSQAVIDGSLLIDFPADTYMHVLNYGLDLTKINNLIVTHCHHDHLYPSEFENRITGYAHLESESTLEVYCTEPTVKMCEGIFSLQKIDTGNRVGFHIMEKYIPFNIDRYMVTPLKACHDQSCDPVIYIISDGIKTMLYANDTGNFPSETWDYLYKFKHHFDFISLDCTKGIINADYDSHMSIEENAAVKEKLIKIGCADSNTIFCTNHFSHNGGATYDEMVPVARKYGFLVSYDGMEINF